MKWLMRLHYNSDDLVSAATAARLARVNMAFLRECQQLGLLEARPRRGGGEGYSAADIRELARARRLHQQLGLSLEAIDVVLHMRRQMKRLRAEMVAMQAEMYQREQQLRRELITLRQQLNMSGEEYQE